jgi:magnesium-transporting ATPase (P-type)
MLSDDRIERIRVEIDKGGISMQELKDDLLDHFCCVVEYEMKKGLSFETAYQRAFEDICPNGFSEIQKETIFLLNSKRILTMKKLMYTIGLLASISFSVGWLFKILHWPGGDELFIYGFLAFVLVFLPLLAIDRYKAAFASVASERLKIILGFSSAIVTGMAVLFKLLHLQGADLLLIVGAQMFSFGFLPFLFYRMYRKSLE